MHSTDHHRIPLEDVLACLEQLPCVFADVIPFESGTRVLPSKDIDESGEVCGSGSASGLMHTGDLCQLFLGFLALSALAVLPPMMYVTPL